MRLRGLAKASMSLAAPRASACISSIGISARMRLGRRGGFRFAEVRFLLEAVRFLGAGLRTDFTARLRACFFVRFLGFGLFFIVSSH